MMEVIHRVEKRSHDDRLWYCLTKRDQNQRYHLEVYSDSTLMVCGLLTVYDTQEVAIEKAIESLELFVSVYNRGRVL